MFLDGPAEIMKKTQLEQGAYV